MKIDVTIATKNSEDTIEQCIRNIKKCIPYNRIILIDDSQDDTTKIAKRFGAEVVHFPQKLGPTRVKQAEVSDTEWIASIDSDVFVYPNWWKVMGRYIAHDVGIIRSFMDGSIKKVIPSYDSFTKYLTEKTFLRRKITTTMGNNLIRRHILLSCREKLANIHAGEDTIIGQHVVDMGYTCVVIREITALHYHKDPISHIKRSYYRDGESCVINRGKLMGLLTTFFSFIDISKNWIDYSFYLKIVDFKLYRLLLFLFIEKIKGAVSEIKKGS